MGGRKLALSFNKTAVISKYCLIFRSTGCMIISNPASLKKRNLWNIFDLVNHTCPNENGGWVIDA